jgi:hypothetical protein
MNEESLLKKSVLLTTKLVGVFALWTLLLSLVVVGITGRAVAALSGADSGKSESATEVDARAKDKPGVSRGATPNSNVIRPNG